MKKFLLFPFILLSSLILLAGSASAFSLGGYEGAIQIDFNGLSTDFGPYESDKIGLLPGQDGIENVWAIGRISNFNSGTPIFDPIWQDGDGGEEITAIIYGADDISVIDSGSAFNIYSAGLSGTGYDGKIHIDLYLNTAGTFDGTLLPGDRTSFSTFPTVTDGTPFLQLELVRGFIADDISTVGIDESLATLSQVASAQTSPASGDGSFHADIVGGDYAHLFGRDGFTNVMGGVTYDADMEGTFTFDVAGGDTSGDVWDNVIRPGSIVGDLVVPEPTTILLFGFGLLSIAGIGRRKS